MIVATGGFDTTSTRLRATASVCATAAARAYCAEGHAKSNPKIA